MTSGQGTWPGSHSQQPAAPHQQASGAPAPSDASDHTQDQKKNETVHTYLYYPGFALAVILGLILAFVIYIWISNNTSAGRIPIWLLALPAILLVAAVRFGDEHLARAFPGLVPASKRAALAPTSASGHDGGAQAGMPPHPYGTQTGQSGYGQPASPAATTTGAAPVGYPAPSASTAQPQPAQPYGQQQAQQQAQPYGQQTPQQVQPGNGGYGSQAGQQPGYGTQAPYGQTGRPS